MLSGEYFVLDGASALALPTHYGQDMTVTRGHHQSGMVWKSFDHQGSVWFEGFFSSEGKFTEGTDEDVGRGLEKIFDYILSVLPDFGNDKDGLLIETRLDFPREWGLGSSSTLIHNLAQWTGVNAYDILWNSMGGSGYDLACAEKNKPILYQIQNGRPFIQYAGFNPPFKQNLFFVYLEQKQNSRAGIKYYKEQSQNKNPEKIRDNISILTRRMINATTINEFENLVRHHEDLISGELKLPKVKNERFHDFWGEVKSLGAWGGDFILATSNRPYQETEEYFNLKGYPIFFSYNEIIL